MIVNKKLVSGIVSVVFLSLIFYPIVVANEDTTASNTIPTKVSTSSAPLIQSDTPRLVDETLDSSWQKEYWAVLVGINNYPGSLGDLPYSINEILSFKTTLLAGGNWEESHIRVVTDEDATRDGIFDALQWLVSNEDTNDVSVFFYAGHGGQGSSNEYLSVYNSSIYDYELDEKLDDLEGCIVVILDCCHAGGFIEDIGERGRVVLSACRKDNLTYQYSGLKSGIFGYFINVSLQKYTKFAEGTFLVALVASYLYSKKLSEDYAGDYTIIPRIYDGCFGRVRLINRHSYSSISFHEMFLNPSKNRELRMWNM